MNSIRFHLEAEAEMNNAAAWYEHQQANLGKRFLASIQDALNRIQLDPALYPVVEADVHRCLVRIFPFGVLFRTMPGIIVIMAVMHLHRDPDYWKSGKFEQGE